jgi:hypothetical protein
VLRAIKAPLTLLFVLALTLTAFTTNSYAVGTNAKPDKPKVHEGKIQKGEKITLQLDSGNIAEITIDILSSGGTGGKQASLSPYFSRYASMTWVERGGCYGYTCYAPQPEVWRYTVYGYWGGDSGIVSYVSSSDSYSQSGWGSFWVVRSRTNGTRPTYPPYNYDAWGHLETYSNVNYVLGYLVVQYCTLDMTLHLDGWGGYWGSYNAWGC